MAKFEKALEQLRYMRRCELATVLLGTKGIFGSTYEDAAQAQGAVDDLDEAIALLEKHQ